MSSNNENPFNGANPFQAMFSGFNQATPGSPVAVEQMFRGMARWQIEAQQLMVRRAQAYLELPGRIAQCRSPQDLMKEQSDFWQTAFANYSEASRRIMAVWTQAARMPAAPEQPAERPPQRDYLTFPEAPRAREQGNTPPVGKRRVA